jgi:RNA polymerase sigma-70 factor (ECF subfamily)
LVVLRGGTAPADRVPYGDSVAEQAKTLWPRALQLCGNPWEAQDLVQDAVERALRFEHHFDRDTNLRAWLQHILLMVFLTRRKRRVREVRMLQGFTEQPESAIGLGVSMDRDLSYPMRDAIERLPEPFRSTVLLVHVQGFRCAEAATMLNVALGTILSRLYRAREMMRRVLGPDFELGGTGEVDAP